MTKEEREILFKDLSGRLAYGVVMDYKESPHDYNEYTIHSLNMSDYSGWMGYCKNVGCGGEAASVPFKIGQYKPYLRPLSSMTEEEMERLTDTHSLLDANGIRNNVCCTVEGMDYLNSIHVDYRGLIPMGLALEAPKEMYKMEE